MVTDVGTALSSFTIRRKVLKIFGASFHIFSPSGDVIGFCKQKAFKLREDIRIYTDESMGQELLTIKARQIIDFSGAYDIVDARESKKVGAARRKGFTSIIRDSWEILDENDRPVGKLQEDNLTLALLRRYLLNFIPQKFHLESNGRREAEMRVRFNPFIYKLDVSVAPESTLDRRLILGAAILLAAIEGRQESN